MPLKDLSLVTAAVLTGERGSPRMLQVAVAQPLGGLITRRHPRCPEGCEHRRPRSYLAVRDGQCRSLCLTKELMQGHMTQRATRRQGPSGL